MSDVLVTGGAGFIGSHLVDRLVAEGATVTVVDDLSSGRAGNLAEAEASGRVRLVRLDIAEDALDDVVAAERPRLVLHLAAQADVRHSVADPVRDAMVNVIGTVRVLEAARRHGTQKVVFATSGGTIYGAPPRSALPVAENSMGHAASPYGASKRCGEEYLHTFAELYGLRWTALALGNVYGPRQDPHGEAGVVAIFALRMLAGEDVTIYGTGEQTRDFVHVADVVDAFMAAAERADGLRVNIGTGRETQVNELFAVLAQQTGYAEAARHAPPRAGELDHIALDASLAGEVLGWKARLPLEQGLAETVAWLRSQAPA